MLDWRSKMIYTYKYVYIVQLSDYLFFKRVKWTGDSYTLFLNFDKKLMIWHHKEINSLMLPHPLNKDKYMVKAGLLFEGQPWLKKVNGWHSDSISLSLLPNKGEKSRGWGLLSRHSNKHAPRNIPEAQDAFKILMIHWILQFALRIAFRCVLHRCGSQDIRRWKLYRISVITAAQAVKPRSGGFWFTFSNKVRR